MATDSILKVTELALPFAFSISTVTMEVENETIYFLVESEDEYNSTVWIFKVEYSYDSDFPFGKFYYNIDKLLLCSFLFIQI